jgi:hypothetical protein
MRASFFFSPTISTNDLFYTHPHLINPNPSTQHALAFFHTWYPHRPQDIRAASKHACTPIHPRPLPSPLHDATEGCSRALFLFPSRTKARAGSVDQRRVMGIRDFEFSVAKMTGVLHFVFVLGLCLCLHFSCSCIYSTQQTKLRYVHYLFILDVVCAYMPISTHDPSVLERYGWGRDEGRGEWVSNKVGRWFLG